MNQRDKLLIRAGKWAGQMDAKDTITLLPILEPIDDVEEFILDCVADYIMHGSIGDFNEFIVEALKDEFGVISSEEAKRIEEESKGPAMYCTGCKHNRKYYDGPTCGPCWRKEEDHFEPEESDA